MKTEDYLKQWREDIVFQARLRGHPFTFHSTWGIFSPREVDEGSRMLIDRVEIHESDDILDLGCGYGPIGISLARLAPKGNTLMVDKDFVAVEYANTNARLNGLNNCQAMLSNGFAQVGNRTFDLVVSNIPAKVGKEMLYLLLYDALEHLNPGGRLYVVTINGLRQFIKRSFTEVFGNYDKLKQGRQYTVAVAEKTSR